MQLSWVIEFVKRNVGTYTPLLAGNSVYVDFLFLKKTTQHLAVESGQTFGRPKLGPLPVVKNRIFSDASALQKYMPDLANLFSHVLVDVSSVKALCVRWYPKENRKAPSKENKHRALDDIRESITELKYYKENIFRSKSKK
ncbi:hypothetical protein Pint_31599 [Pistacia integerrima]|uniref:Uncharacterized protein n=1 Tax=Pistacia integerrima TaxID=434235 RepID=A0ACC0XNB8_9ROSI|nr:hypothetical protein Pint_31599 [Pistacia integerrima]